MKQAWGSMGICTAQSGDVKQSKRSTLLRQELVQMHVSRSKGLCSVTSISQEKMYTCTTKAYSADTQQPAPSGNDGILIGNKDFHVPGGCSELPKCVQTCR